MCKRLLILAITAALAGACSTYHDTGYQHPETMTQQYSQFDVVMGWDVQVAGGNTLIKGVVKNVRYLYMNDLEIWVVALNPAGKVMARSVDFVIPQPLQMDETAAFELKLPVAVTPGSKLRFTYKYRGSDGGDGPELGGAVGDTNWWQSFDFVLPAS